MDNTDVISNGIDGNDTNDTNSMHDVDIFPKGSLHGRDFEQRGTECGIA